MQTNAKLRKTHKLRSLNAACSNNLMSQSLGTLASSSLLQLLLLLLLCFNNFPSSDSLVIPNELPSLLSLVYSNIPPIKKGTDSRLGFGFRVGDHADFQVLLELGPQKETRPIGDQDGKTSFNKRQVSKMEQRKALLRLEKLQLQQQLEQQQLTSTERSASNWLQNWSQDMSFKKKPIKTQKRKVTQNTKQEIELPPMPLLPEQSYKQLQLLYKMASTTEVAPTAMQPINVMSEESQESQPTSSLGIINPRHAPQVRKTKGEITEELMDVSLDDE